MLLNDNCIRSDRMLGVYATLTSLPVFVDPRKHPYVHPYKGRYLLSPGNYSHVCGITGLLADANFISVSAIRQTIVNIFDKHQATIQRDRSLSSLTISYHSVSELKIVKNISKSMYISTPAAKTFNRHFYILSQKPRDLSVNSYIHYVSLDYQLISEKQIISFGIVILNIYNYDISCNSFFFNTHCEEGRMHTSSLSSSHSVKQDLAFFGFNGCLTLQLFFSTFQLLPSDSIRTISASRVHYSIFRILPPN